MPWDAPYATDEDLLAFSDIAVNYPEEDRARALERAQGDIDSVLGGRWPLLDNGQRVNPLDPYTPLTNVQLIGLRDATTAQAEWRLYKGVEHFLEPSQGTIHGPDFTIEAGSGGGYWAKRALHYLRAVGLLLTGARAVP